MFSLTRRLLSRPQPPAVLSLLVQARRDTTHDRTRGPFEVLVRHLLTRLMTSESLGISEESTARVAQMAYAVALPGLVVALFLYPLYHQPAVFGPRLYWPQASDHFFYVLYSFVVMGLVTVLQWDLLFPDLLDVLFLTSLPLRASRLLLARASALTIFFGYILLGTSFLGILFLPAVADIRGIGVRHFAAHAIAVLLSGLFIATALIATQGLFITLLGERLARRVGPIVQAICVVLLLTILFLFPILSHFLQALLRANTLAVRCFPPFWFLGLYERLLWRAAAPPLFPFQSLAHTALGMTALSSALAILTYPLAYLRRTRQAIEGTGLRAQRPLAQPFNTLLHRTFLTEPKQRAIIHLITQTLWRAEHLRLLLSVFAGLGLAMTTAEVLLIRTNGHAALGLMLSPFGIRLAVPVMAFWTVAGIRAAMLTPFARAGGWAFRVIHGRPKSDHLYATETWVALATSLVTLATAAILHAFAPPELRGTRILIEQAFLALAVSVLLTQIFFLRVSSIPFTEARPYSVNDLSFVVVTCVVLFPIFAYTVVSAEPWIEAAPSHLPAAVAITAAASILLRRLRTRLIDHEARRLDMEDEVLIPGEMGLR